MMVSDSNDDEIVFCSICNNIDPPKTPDEPDIGKKDDNEKNNDEPNVKWIRCDRCNDWVHEICDFDGEEYKNIEIYYCPECRAGGKQIVFKKQSKNNQDDSANEETESNHDVSILSQTLEKLNLTTNSNTNDNLNKSLGSTSKTPKQAKSTKTPLKKGKKRKKTIQTQSKENRQKYEGKKKQA